MDLAALLARLRDRSPSGPAAALAELVLDDLLQRRLGDLIDPAQLARVLHDRAPLWLGSPGAALAAEGALAEVLSWLDCHPGPIGAHLPGEAKASLRRAARLPFIPDRELLTQILSRPAVRKLVRESLLDVLVAFARRLGGPASESKVARGFGELGRFAARTGALGALASNVVGAISDEVGRQAERLADQSADAAVTRLIQHVIDTLTEPARVADQAALREALLEGALELTGAQLARQLRNNPLGPAARELREGLAHWLDSALGRALVAESVQSLLARAGALTLREVLERFSLLEPLRATAVEAAQRYLEPLIGGEAFAAWIASVASDAPE